MFAFGIHISDSYAARLTHGFILGLADGLISFNGLAAMFGDRPNHETWIVVGELFPNLALRLRHQIARRANGRHGLAQPQGTGDRIGVDLVPRLALVRPQSALGGEKHLPQLIQHRQPLVRIRAGPRAKLQAPVADPEVFTEVGRVAKSHRQAGRGVGQIGSARRRDRLRRRPGHP